MILRMERMNASKNIENWSNNKFEQKADQHSARARTTAHSIKHLKLTPFSVVSSLDCFYHWIHGGRATHTVKPRAGFGCQLWSSNRRTDRISRRRLHRRSDILDRGLRGDKPRQPHISRWLLFELYESFFLECTAGTSLQEDHENDECRFQVHSSVDSIYN